MQNLGLLVPILAILLGPLMYWMHIKEKKDQHYQRVGSAKGSSGCRPNDCA